MALFETVQTKGFSILKKYPQRCPIVLDPLTEVLEIQREMILLFLEQVDSGKSLWDVTKDIKEFFKDRYASLQESIRFEVESVLPENMKINYDRYGFRIKPIFEHPLIPEFHMDGKGKASGSNSVRMVSSVSSTRFPASDLNLRPNRIESEKAGYFIGPKYPLQLDRMADELVCDVAEPGSMILFGEERYHRVPTSSEMIKDFEAFLRDYMKDDDFGIVVVQNLPRFFATATFDIIEIE